MLSKFKLLDELKLSLLKQDIDATFQTLSKIQTLTGALS